MTNIAVLGTGHLGCGAVGAGKLSIFVGGPGSVIEQVEPVLRDLGTIRHCGPVGTGTALRLVVNTAMITALGALHDTLAVADAVGIDQALALDTLTAGPLNGAINRATNTDARFAVSLAAKDLRLALNDVQTARSRPPPYSCSTTPLISRRTSHP